MTPSHTPAVAALLQRCERVAHQRGLTGHDLFAGLGDWLERPLDLGAIERGEIAPAPEDLAALYGALGQHVDADEDDVGFEHISDVLARIMPRILAGEPVQ